MSVRIGIAPGVWRWTGGPAAFFDFVERTEQLGWDSIWLSDRLIAGRVRTVAVADTPAADAKATPEVVSLDLEPVTALAAAAARTRTLKFGTSVLALPLRNPAVLAKELATVDFLSGGRVFPAVGLGGEDEREYEAAGVRKQDRGAQTDEAITVLRRLWGEDVVTHHGRFFHLTDVSIRPRPAVPLPIWIGGRSGPAWRRVARLGDGWIASSISPGEVRDGIDAIGGELRIQGREIEPDHYGVMIPTYVCSAPGPALQRLAGELGRRRADIPIETYVAVGSIDAIHERIAQYIAAGASKFVLRLACPEDEALDQLESLAGLL